MLFRSVATWAAAALNVLVGSIGLVLARGTRHVPPATMPDVAPADRTSLDVLLAIGLSGFTALASEVVWTRLLSLQFGATVYTFSLILAGFLGGLGIGSFLAGRSTRDVERSRIALAACQLAIVAAIAWAAWQISASLPHWDIAPAPPGGAAPMFVCARTDNAPPAGVTERDPSRIRIRFMDAIKA